jgi:hypothetical protein
MIEYFFIVFGLYILYTFFIKGIIWIVRNKLKHGNKVSFWFFPFVGPVIKIALISLRKYGKVFHNLTLERRQDPNLKALVFGGGAYNGIILLDAELIKDFYLLEAG